MSHMQAQVGFGTWLVVEGDGTEFLPDTFGIPLSPGEVIDYTSPLFADMLSCARDYTSMFPETIREFSMREGWGARLSAPGYMDCTDWLVFSTEAEARAYLEEFFGDGEGSDT